MDPESKKAMSLVGHCNYNMCAFFDVVYFSFKFFMLLLLFFTIVSVVLHYTLYFCGE